MSIPLSAASGATCLDTNIGCPPETHYEASIHLATFECRSFGIDHQWRRNIPLEGNESGVLSWAREVKGLKAIKIWTKWNLVMTADFAIDLARACWCNISSPIFSVRLCTTEDNNETAKFLGRLGKMVGLRVKLDLLEFPASMSHLSRDVLSMNNVESIQTTPSHGGPFGMLCLLGHNAMSSITNLKATKWEFGQLPSCHGARQLVAAFGPHARKTQVTAVQFTCRKNEAEKCNQLLLGISEVSTLGAVAIEIKDTYVEMGANNALHSICNYLLNKPHRLECLRLKGCLSPTPLGPAGDSNPIYDALGDGRVNLNELHLDGCSMIGGNGICDVITKNKTTTALHIRDAIGLSGLFEGIRIGISQNKTLRKLELIEFYGHMGFGNRSIPVPRTMNVPLFFHRESPLVKLCLSFVMHPNLDDGLLLTLKHLPGSLRGLGLKIYGLTEIDSCLSETSVGKLLGAVTDHKGITTFHFSLDRAVLSDPDPISRGPPGNPATNPSDLPFYINQFVKMISVESSLQILDIQIAKCSLLEYIDADEYDIATHGKLMQQMLEEYKRNTRLHTLILKPWMDPFENQIIPPDILGRSHSKVDTLYDQVLEVTASKLVKSVTEEWTAAVGAEEDWTVADSRRELAKLLHLLDARFGNLGAPCVNRIRLATLLNYFQIHPKEREQDSLKLLMKRTRKGASQHVDADRKHKKSRMIQ